MNLWPVEHFCPPFFSRSALISTDLEKNGGQKCSTGQRFIFTEVTFYKIYILVSTYYLLYLLTYYYWKLKRKIDFVSWPAQHFLLVIKKLYFFLFSPSCFVCSSEPTSVWWWKLPSSTKLQFSFSIFCLHWWKKSNLQIDVPKLWMPVSMKNQSFLAWYFVSMRL